MTDVVRAAGGVPWRRRNGVVEVLLVHRPRYDDWSLPKGKCHDGESAEECAGRELEEETGLAVPLGPELASTSYTDSRGREKHVRFWAVGPVSDDAGPRHEIDAVDWLTPEAAKSRLTYERDRDVLASFLQSLG